MNTKQFGERVAALRKARNMTQSQLAEELNVSNKTISRWETGDGYPEITLLVPLAKSLGVTVDFLLHESEPAAASESASCAQNSAGKGHRHREVPVVWPWHRRTSFVRKPHLWNHLLHCGFYVLATCIFCSANHYSLYPPDSDASTGLQGYFTGKIFGFVLLAFVLAAVLLLAAVNVHLLRRNKERKVECIGNIGISMFYLLAVFWGVRPVCGTWIKDSYFMKQYAEGSLLHGFDWFQYNRKLIFAAGCLAIGFYLLFHLMLYIRKRRILKKSMSDASRSQMDNIKLFWSSLILPNKIAAAAVLISVLGILFTAGIYILAFLIDMAGMKWGTSMFLVMMVTIFTNISTAAAKAGLLAAIIGIGAGLFDCCDRQYKASIILAVINVIFIYLLPMLLVILQFANIINLRAVTSSLATLG